MENDMADLENLTAEDLTLEEIKKTTGSTGNCWKEEDGGKQEWEVGGSEEAV